MKLRRSLLCLAILAVVPLVFFGRGLVHASTLEMDDLRYWFYPWKAMLYRMASQGRVSLWSGGEFGGMPHQADIQRQLFYPPNVIFYLLPTSVAMIGFVAGHFALAAWGMYLWLRSLPERLAPRRMGALAGAMVFAFAGFPVLHLSQLPVLASYAWLGFALRAVERVLQWEGPGGVVELAVAWAMIILGGSPQIGYIGGTFGLLYAVVHLGQPAPQPPSEPASVPRSGLALGHRLLRLGLGGLAGLGLAACQLVPTFELAMQSSRRQVPLVYSSIGTAPPAMLKTFLHPYLLGNPHEDTWTGQAYVFHEQCFYVGLLTLVLAAAGVAAWRRAPRTVLFMVCAAVLGVVLALGNHISVMGTGLHDACVRWVPLFGHFRVPARWMIWTVLALSALAAMGVDELSRVGQVTGRRLMDRWLSYLLASLAILGLGSALVYGCGQLLEYETEAPWVALQLLACLVALGLAAGFRRRAELAIVGIVYLMSVDLVRQANRYVLFTPVPVVESSQAVLPHLLQEPRPFRIATHATGDIAPQVSTWAAALGLANIQGTNPLFLESYLEFLYFSQAGRLPFDDDASGLMHHNGFFLMRPLESPMTRLLDLRFIITGPQALGDRYYTARPKAGLPRGDERGGLTVRPTLLPSYGRAWAVHDYQVEPSHEIRLHRLRTGQVDPSRCVLLDTLPPQIPGGPSGVPKGKVTLRHYEDDLIEVETTLDRPAFVVFSEIYYPGWQATVDGKPTRVLRAHDLFRAVVVGQGLHHIRLRFAPGSLQLGLALTVLTMLALGGLALHAVRPRELP
jgi:Bacterial membrane protein YfhO